MWLRKMAVIANMCAMCNTLVKLGGLLRVEILIAGDKSPFLIYLTRTGRDYYIYTSIRWKGGH